MRVETNDERTNASARAVCNIERLLNAEGETVVTAAPASSTSKTITSKAIALVKRDAFIICICALKPVSNTYYTPKYAPVAEAYAYKAGFVTSSPLQNDEGSGCDGDNTVSEVEVELRVSGDNDGAIAFTALGEDVHEESLHSVWSCRTDVDSVASTRIEFVGLARCSTLEDGSLATERQEVLERQ